MIAEQDPCIPPCLDLDPVHSLPPEDRALLTTLLTGSGSIADLAQHCGLDLLTLAERILAPEIQAALEAIKEAATQLSHIRALIGRPVALATLEAVSTEINPSPIERRRAASALLRAAPIAPAPRASSFNKAPSSSTPPTQDVTIHDHVNHEPAPSSVEAQRPAARQIEPARPEPFDPQARAPSPAPSATARVPERIQEHFISHASPDRPTPQPKSRDRPFVPIRKPPLIAAA